MKITVMDEHHEAFLFWARAIEGGKIRKGSILLHVDGHSDLAIPNLTRSIYSDDVVGLVEDELQIGSFILPAVLRGFFDEVIFLGRGVKPKARRQKRIGSLRGEGVWLNTDLGRTKFTNKLYPDSRPWFYTIVNDPLSVRPPAAVLDIDLDYFYGYLFPQPPYGVKLTTAQKRHLAKVWTSQDGYRLALRLVNLEDGILKYSGLPRFKDIIVNRSKEWIDCAIRYFVESLRTKPEIISICRSVKSGFTPQEHAAYAEETLIKCLKGRPGTGIDPCAISSPLEAYPFIVRIGNKVYNPVTDDTIKLKEDSRFIWDKIEEKKNFPQILEAMEGRYDLPRPALKKELLRFVLRLKNNVVLK